MQMSLIVLLSASALFFLYMFVRTIAEFDAGDDYNTWKSKVLHFWKFQKVKKGVKTNG